MTDHQCMYLVPKLLFDMFVKSTKSVSNQHKTKQMNQIEVQEGGRVVVNANDTIHKIIHKGPIAEEDKVSKADLSEENDSNQENAEDLSSRENILHNHHEGEDKESQTGTFSFLNKDSQTELTKKENAQTQYDKPELKEVGSDPISHSDNKITQTENKEIQTNQILTNLESEANNLSDSSSLAVDESSPLIKDKIKQPVFKKPSVKYSRIKPYSKIISPKKPKKSLTKQHKSKFKEVPLKVKYDKNAAEIKDLVRKPFKIIDAAKEPHSNDELFLANELPISDKKPTSNKPDISSSSPKWLPRTLRKRKALDYAQLAKPAKPFKILKP